MKMKWGVIGALLVLTGCASMKYTKAGASDEDYQRAIAGCRVQGAMVPQKVVMDSWTPQ